MSASQGPTIRKRNPGMLQSDEEIREQFVVREHELATGLEILRENIDADSCQHTLIVAPRGRGKTMLLARVAAELRADSELASRLLPVRFMEESDEVFSAADFWLEVLFYLALAVDEQDSELARNLRETRADLTTRWRERELDERARVAVLEAADTLGRRLVLMVENLQAMCANVDEDFGWKLRKTLQTEPQIILVATATSRFEALDDARQPFFELFRIISLAPLDAAQCGLLWKVFSGEAPSERQQRALEILTGGSPRFVVIVAGFARHRTLRQLMEELVQLIDDLTDTFRGYQEALPKTECRVFLAIADLWQSSSTGEIAARARMDVRTVSTMLGRLVERGAVIWDGSGRKRLYRVTEPLYCIYYQLRRERDQAAVVQNLVRFMAVFYTEREILKLFGTLELEALDFQSRVARTLINKGVEQAELGWFAAAITTFENVEQRYRESDEAELQAWAAQSLAYKAAMQDRLGNPEAAIRTSEEVVERFGACKEAAIQVHVAGALLQKSASLGKLGRHPEAIAAAEAVMRHYGHSADPEPRVLVARAMNNKSTSHALMGDASTSIETSNAIVGRFGSSDTPELQAQIATALFHKGMTQIRNGRADEALLTANRLESRRQAADQDIRISFDWKARYVRMCAILSQGRRTAAVDAFCSLYAAFTPENETMIPELIEAVAVLVSAGVPEREIVEVLRSDPQKTASVAPLAIALRQRDGETVRAPAEMLEVAADVRKRFDETEALPASTIPERRVEA